MIKNDLHHPVTNGKTKSMVFMSLIFIFTITITALIFSFIASFHLEKLALWLVKGLFGSIALTGLGALVGVTQKFFDTRTAEIKSKDKLHANTEKHAYKIKRYEIKMSYKYKK